MSARRAVIIEDRGYSDLARALGLTRQRVWHWFRPGNRIPAEWVLEVERVTGVSRHDLRPDIYGPPPVAAREDA